MKKKVLFSIALAGLMLGACSKDVIDNGGNGASWNENGEGYISLNLNLPSTSGSRADDSNTGVEFADGEAKEYAVKDAILMLFTGKDEGTATFNSAYKMDLGNWNMEGTSGDQITSSAKIVQKINEIDDVEKIYALVVLNGNGIFQVESDNASLKIETSEEEYTTLRVATKTTLSRLNDIVAKVEAENSYFWNKTGFLMSNSPLFNVPGGSASNTPSGNVSVLSEIDVNKIYPTESAAAADVAATIFVERAQAKVQVKYSKDEGKTEIKNPNNVNEDVKPTVTYKYIITGWDIDNYNTKSFLTRKFSEGWANYSNSLLDPPLYRFVDGSQVKASYDLYRTYWGEDVNYGNKTDLVTVEGKSPVLKLENDEIAYCFENTSSIVPAVVDESTRIIVSAQLYKEDMHSPESFFLVNNDRFNMYFNDSEKSSIQDKIKEYLLNNEDVKQSIDEVISDKGYVGNFTGNNLKVTLDLDNVSSGKLNNEVIDVEIVSAGEDGLNIINFSDWDSVTPVITSALNAEDSSNNPYFVVDYYEDGICYYEAFIRHFNDSEAPLINGDYNADETDANLLGRYGVLRNNWYVININSIKNIGSSTVPELPGGETIDKIESFLSVDINIMPWAKREQNVDL